MIPALENQLLQSTIFAALAALLTLVLRNNHARTRYWLWFAASMKFLIPFSLFVEIGHRLSWSTATAIRVQPQLSFVMDAISQPFVSPPAPATVTIATAPSILPMLLLAIWISGSAAVLLYWSMRWSRAAAILRTAVPIRKGRTFESLQRLGGQAKLLSSTTQTEPGVFGILKPALSLPAGIADHLDDAQLDAIIAHELTHIRRHDNLTAALHMLVEAVFWFHPMTWWIGARLVEERENACDEEVIRLGSDPELYAESILKICKLCIESPLVCVSGVTGADLMKRIEAIMTGRARCGVSVAKKIMLGAAGLFALVTPIAIGAITGPASHAQAPTRVVTSAPPQPRFLAQATAAPHPAPATSAPPAPLKFEVASIRENPGPWQVLYGYTASGPRLTLEAYSADALIEEAYGLKNYQVIAAQPLRASLGTYYNIAAKAEGDGAPTRGEFRQMLRTLLADRFAFTFHREMREMPVYALVVGKNGPKLKESNPEVPGPPTYHGVNGRNQFSQLSQATMDSLTDDLNHAGLDKPVLNETGLTGKYDIRLEATPVFRMNNNPQPDDLSIFTATQEQLGLKLEERKRPIEVMVIDNIGKPSEN